MTGIFSPEQLDKIVNETLPQDEDKSHAVVFGIDQDGAKVVASFKRSPDSIWTLQAAAQHEWSGDNKVGGKLVLAW